ncbi:SDR family NAD(P)-dependent oxidoreductase [Planococcus sp. ISL-110]|uniref:SDR family NAD(P)-dependent oxidoreductase n=1 Tax=Planococcus sp. ISL-110 TaxID=2819167 RepID=UPI001BEA558E|nr:SDR family NAD(P)-dependent oxidoreductase [Planococcus sp. ISL-110]MBT2571198.1 SDR family NAD(P)-dependent oxidoreductase [Planococcus sp. ISL-110]
MKMDKQRLLEILHRSLVPFLIVFRHFRTFVLVGFENIEEKLEHAALPPAPHLTGKIVMVTGAGGLIGTEISRQLIQFQPAQILLLGHGPKSICAAEHHLQKLLERHTEIISIIVDVQDKKRIFEIVGRHKPDIIYHTAGQQQVDVTEEKPVEALYGNVFGTNNIAEAANRHRIGVFVMVSSENASKPRNLREAAKRLAEMTVESIAMTSLTRYMTVQLPGNLDDKHLSKKQHSLLEQKSPVVYAAQHVLQAGRPNANSSKGSLFQQRDATIRAVPGKQVELSQIEMARLLKQLKTASEDEARKLVISIIKQ